jgi:Tfp pilus assembly protein PilF
MGNRYRRDRDYKRAIGSFRAATEANPKNHEAWNHLSITYTNAGQYENALEANKKALELRPKYPYYWVNKGFIYNNKGEPENAIKAFKEGIELNPRYMNLWDNLVTTYFDMGNYEKAIKSCKKQLKIKPRYGLGWYNKGDIYYKSGNYEKAVKQLKKAIQFDKNLKIAYLTLIRIYTRQGKFELATELREKSKKLKNLYGKINNTMKVSRSDVKVSLIIGILLIIGGLFLFRWIEIIPGTAWEDTASSIFPVATGILLLGLFIVILFIFKPSWLEAIGLIFKALTGDFDSHSGDFYASTRAASLKVKKDELKTIIVTESSKIAEVRGLIKEIAEKSLLIVFPEKEAWIPKSVIHSEYITETGIKQTFSIDSWILKKHSIRPIRSS